MISSEASMYYNINITIGIGMANKKYDVHVGTYIYIPIHSSLSSESINIILYYDYLLLIVSR